MKRRSAVYVGLILGLFASACAPPIPQTSSATGGQPNQGRKQIVAALFATPAGLQDTLTAVSSGSQPGMAELFSMVNGTMTYVDVDNVRHPWLAEAVPTIENGLWRVFTDGRMETTWRLKPGIKWHDGVAMTADDLRFTFDMYRDRDLGLPQLGIVPLISQVDAPDAQTVVVTWQKTSIDADSLFSWNNTMWPLPRHILDQPLRENKEGFLGLPYWREAFIGTGPFKMVDWVEGSHAMLVANDEYVLGRPRLDRIEVRFFADKGALKAGLIAGTVHVPVGRGLNADDALQLRDITPDVKVAMGVDLAGVLPIYPQFINPDPPIVANLQFRRALLMAIDRQEMTDTINNGIGPVAHSWVQADRPEAKAVDGSIVRYPYDPRAAVQMIDGLGYTRSADGIFQAAGGSKLSVQLAAHQQNSIHLPSTLAVAGYWQQIGVDVQTDLQPAVRATDLQWRALYPAFMLLGRSIIAGPDGFFNSNAIPMAETNYRGANSARYASAEIDGLIERYITTISFPDRMKVLGEMVHQQTDQVLMLPLFFKGGGNVLGSARMKNVLGGTPWNAHLWDLE